MIHHEDHRILIWGKTYPELSSKYDETVCTGGVLEDGTPIRLFPVPYRYLEGEQKFKNYQWIRARISRELKDPRPESHRIVGDSIIVEDFIASSPNEWGSRASVMFQNPKWQFASQEALQEQERIDRTSLGVVTPAEIIDVKIKERTGEERETFEQKLERKKADREFRRQQPDLFDGSIPPEMKSLEYVSQRLQVHWKCHGPDCKTHNMQILDWGTIELQRRVGMEKAREKLLETLNLEKNNLKFFLGNIHNHPTSFMIVGLWYPKRQAPTLF